MLKKHGWLVVVSLLLLTFSAYGQQEPKREMTEEEIREAAVDLVKSRDRDTGHLKPLVLVPFKREDNPCGKYFLPSTYSGLKGLAMRFKVREGTFSSSTTWLHSDIRVKLEESKKVPTAEIVVPELKENTGHLPDFWVLIRISKQDFEAANKEVCGCLPAPQSDPL